MNTSDEKKYLAGILKFLDRAPRSVFLSPWFKVAHWYGAGHSSVLISIAKPLKRGLPNSMSPKKNSERSQAANVPITYAPTSLML